MVNNRKPSFAEERELRSQGYRLIAGVDEVGRGALMGPVVAAAVILPANFRAGWRSRVRDSKQLRPKDREYLSGCIREKAIAVGIGVQSNDVIDAIGIAVATRLAMIAAIQQLMPEPQFLLIDYFKIPELSMPQKGIVDGDGKCFSIACASIIAKVARDSLVTKMDEEYPGYEFAKHKGYGTRRHIDSLRRIGPCPVHRWSFRPVRETAGQWI